MNPYAVDKIIFHPKYVQAFAARCSHEMFPIVVHLMPNNSCNHNCHFCSYRMKDWKNSEYFDKKSSMPWPIMFNLINELNDMGIKAIEITGGGEPLLYPHINKLLEELSMLPIDTALVTNGTLLKDFTAELLYSTNLRWARVSIDAGSKDTYCKIRRCPESHWAAALTSVKMLVERRTHQVIGIGNVITDMNYLGILELCKLAKDSGVNNIRVSVAFTSKGVDILSPEQIKDVQHQLEEAHKLNDKNFQVVDLFSERLANLSLQQDYDYCGTKDILCVIDGECNVWTCCTLTGSKHGLIGSIKDKSFLQLWGEKSYWRNNFDPRKICKCACLYEHRNKTMLTLMEGCDHANFI